jgi:hypothetical protein
VTYDQWLQQFRSGRNSERLRLIVTKMLNGLVGGPDKDSNLGPMDYENELRSRIKYGNSCGIRTTS